jgi:hypothetical protein
MTKYRGRELDDYIQDMINIKLIQLFGLQYGITDCLKKHPKIAKKVKEEVFNGLLKEGYNKQDLIKRVL